MAKDIEQIFADIQRDLTDAENNMGPMRAVGVLIPALRKLAELVEVQHLKIDELKGELEQAQILIDKTRGVCWECGQNRAADTNEDGRCSRCEGERERWLERVAAGME